MGWLDQAWKDNVVKPIEAGGRTLSNEFKNAMSGGLDPGVWLNKEIRRSSRSAARGVAEVLRSEIDYAFRLLRHENTNSKVGLIVRYIN